MFYSRQEQLLNGSWSACPPTVVLIGCSSVFEELFSRGGIPWGDEYPDGLDILTNSTLDNI